MRVFQKSHSIGWKPKMLALGMPLLLIAEPSFAAPIIQTVNSNGTSTAWNTAIWGSPASAPSTSNDYFTAASLATASSTFLGTGTDVTGRVRAYNGSASFAGSSLSVVASTELLLKSVGTTYSGKFVLNGGVIRFAPDSGGSTTLLGTIDVVSNSTLGIVQSFASTFTIGSIITGSGKLRLAAGQNNANVIKFDDGAGTSLNGFSGVIEIGGGSSAVAVVFSQPYNLAGAGLTMGTKATSDVLTLNANVTVSAFTFGSTLLTPGTYSMATLNATFGNGSQFTGSGTLTVGINPDSDYDGLPDSFEDQIIAHNPSDMVIGYGDVAGPNNAPTATDFDGDGLSDAAEYANDTDPTKPDSDGDGLKDGAEVTGRNNLGTLTGFAPTNPKDPDSDKDGYGDGVEAAAGTDPKSETAVPPAAAGNPRSLPLLTAEHMPGGFSILSVGWAAPVIYAPSDATVVKKAALLLADDVEAVGGVRPLVSDSVDGVSGPAILVGTLGKSPLIDGLVVSGKLDVSGIRGNWESYRLAYIENPLPGIPGALIVAGSDRRGTAYGLGAISEAMGVSPWTWWADVAPPSRPQIHLAGLPIDSTPPSVRYRGIFINDEDWGLQEWAEKNYESGAGDVKDIGPKTYARIFELLLRLRANYCWPGMHPSTAAFNHYADNKVVADDYGIVMGSSHAEPMLRNNVYEWYNDIDPVSGSTYSNGSWDYSVNKAGIYRYWDQRVLANSPYENVFTVGKRGIHDSGMVEGANNTEKAAWLNTIFSDQRQILASRVNKDPTLVPQVFVPYKEVLGIYDTGLVNVPDDVTLVWPDDNHGYIRRLSSAAEQSRTGGGGVYYHLSYWGDPKDYLWLSSIPPSLIWEEMSKAYENRCRRLWVFNVGDIKPAEISMEYALRLAWNVHSYGPDSQMVWLKEWAKREFGTEESGAISSLINDYFRLNHARKPEHMDWRDRDSGSSAPLAGNYFPLFSQVHEGDEVESRIREFKDLRERADGIFNTMSSEQRDAFYQLVVYPVRGSEAMTRKFLHTSRAYRAIAQKRRTVEEHSAAAISAYNEIGTETNYFNTTLAGGKWSEMMDWKPRGLEVFNMPVLPSDPGPQSVGLGVAVEGRLTPIFTGSSGGGDAAVVLDAVDQATSVVAPMQVANLDGRRCLWTPGSGGTVAAGVGGRASYMFNVPVSGSYSIKFEVRTPSANDDSWHISLDGGAPQVWNNMGVDNPSGWRWLTWNTVSLAAGNHTLVVHEREDGAAFAAIRIANASLTGELGEDDRFNDFRLPEFNSISRRSFFVDLINTDPVSIPWSATTDDPWILLSSNSGILDKEQRVTVSIDWNQLPASENLTSAIRFYKGSASIEVPVSVWNPATSTATDFIEENGAIVIEAEHPSASYAGTDASWIEVPNLGRGDGSMVVKSTSAPSLTTSAAILAQAPSLEYSFHLRTPGSRQINATFLPALSLNNDRGRRYAVSVDGDSPTIVALSGESGSGSTWSRSVLRSSITGSSIHVIPSAGNHHLRIWMVDPGLVLDRIEIQTSNVPYSYNGLRETSTGEPSILWVAAGETHVLDGANHSYKRIVNHGTLEVRGAVLSVDEDLINFGTLRVIGASAINSSGNVANFGLVDSMSWNPGGVGGFSDYSDFGSELDSSSFKIEDHWLDGNGFHLRVPGYEGHRYSLQRSEDLKDGAWIRSSNQLTGSGRIGAPVPITLSWPATGSRMFFRVELDGSE